MERNLNRNANSFQQSEQSPLILTELTQANKNHDIWRWKYRCYLGTGI